MAGKLYLSPPKFSQVPSAIRQDVPVYRLREDIFTDDTLFLKGATLETDDDFEPNLAMFPVNEVALKKYRAFLKAHDAKAEEFYKLPAEERRGHLQVLPKLPAFEKEWEKVNNLSKSKGIHLVHAVDQSPAILGAPRSGKPSVRQVDMSMVGNIPHEDDTAVGKGNTADKDMSSVNAVKASLPA